MKTSMTASRVGPVRLVSASIAAVFGANARVGLTAGGDEVVQERDPVAVVLVEAIPERAKSRSTGEVGEERGLAVAGIGEDEDDPVVDLRGEPIEQPMTRQRLIPQRRRLDLRVLDRIAAHVVAVGSAALCGGDRRSARADGNRQTVACAMDGLGGLWPRERYGSLASGVNGRVRQCHGRHGAGAGLPVH